MLEPVGFIKEEVDCEGPNIKSHVCREYKKHPLNLKYLDIFKNILTTLLLLYFIKYKLIIIRLSGNYYGSHDKKLFGRVLD